MRRAGLVVTLTVSLVLLFAPIAPATEGDAPPAPPDLSDLWPLTLSPRLRLVLIPRTR